MAVRSSRPPGSAVLRAEVAARVVAARSTVPTVGLDFCSPQHGEHYNFNNEHRDQSATSTTVDDFTAYDAYVHVPTRVRAIIPVDIDPSTGAHIPVFPVPLDYYPVQPDGEHLTTHPARPAAPRN